MSRPSTNPIIRLFTRRNNGRFDLVKAIRTKLPFATCLKGEFWVNRDRTETLCDRCWQENAWDFDDFEAIVGHSLVKQTLGATLRCHLCSEVIRATGKPAIECAQCILHYIEDQENVDNGEIISWF